MDISITRIDSVTVDVSQKDNKYRIVQLGHEQRIYSVYLDTNKIYKYRYITIGMLDALREAIIFATNQILKRIVV